MEEKRITVEELSKIMGVSCCTIRTWLGRSEFSKFYRHDKFFGKQAISYVYNDEFIKRLVLLLKSKYDISPLNRFLAKVNSTELK